MSEERSLTTPTHGSQQIEAHESKLYTWMAPVYDVFFSFMYSHIRAAIKRLNIQPRERVLEIGVGTGPSLSAYPAHCSVLGVDIAAPMLARAQQKIEQRGLSHIQVRRMSALSLDLPDSSMDRVIAFHVVSVIPDVYKMMRELSRVCKPGGSLHVINYFCGESPKSQIIGELLDPLTRCIGWSSTLTRSSLFAKSDFKEEHARRTSSLSAYWEIQARNKK